MMNTQEAIEFAKDLPRMTMHGPIPAATIHALAAALVETHQALMDAQDAASNERKDHEATKAELEQFVEANHSFAVCADHVDRAVYTEEIPCLVCRIEELERDVKYWSSRFPVKRGFRSLHDYPVGWGVHEAEGYERQDRDRREALNKSLAAENESLKAQILKMKSENGNA